MRPRPRPPRRPSGLRPRWTPARRPRRPLRRALTDSRTGIRRGTCRIDLPPVGAMRSRLRRAGTTGPSRLPLINRGHRQSPGCPSAAGRWTASKGQTLWRPSSHRHADEHARTCGPKIGQRADDTGQPDQRAYDCVPLQCRGRLPSARRPLMVGGMLPWPLNTLLSSGSMHRWFPLWFPNLRLVFQK